MPAHAEGRLCLTRHALAFGLIVPVAALLLAGAVAGLVYPDFAHVGVFTLFVEAERAPDFMHGGNRAAAPVVTALTAAIAGMHFGIGWAMLDRDWTRVAALARLGVAMTITLVVFASLAVLDVARTLLPVAGMSLEVLALVALVRLHAPSRTYDNHVAG